MNILLSLVLLLSSVVDSGEEVYLYDILIKGNKVGELEARRTVQGTQVTYSNRSLTKARLLKSIEVLLVQEGVYVNGILQSAKSTTLINDHRHSHTEIRKNGSDYLVVTDDGSFRQSGSIRYSAVKLMLDEPEAAEISFSEHEGEYHRLVRVDEHSYLKMSPDGKENIYHYRNGRLHSAKIDAGFYSFEIKLRN